MIHYVLLKFAPGTDLDAAEARVRKTYEELDEALTFLNEPKVYRCCIERDSNADIMAMQESMNTMLTQAGVDTSTEEELLCSHRTLEEARQVLGADSLGYLSPESTRDSCFGCADPCQACFTGEYPTLLYEEMIEND